MKAWHLIVPLAIYLHSESAKETIRSVGYL